MTNTNMLFAELGKLEGCLQCRPAQYREYTGFSGYTTLSHADVNNEILIKIIADFSYKNVSSVYLKKACHQCGVTHSELYNVSMYYLLYQVDWLELSFLEWRMKPR